MKKQKGNFDGFYERKQCTEYVMATKIVKVFKAHRTTLYEKCAIPFEKYGILDSRMIEYINARKHIHLVRMLRGIEQHGELAFLESVLNRRINLKKL